MESNNISGPRPAQRPAGMGGTFRAGSILGFDILLHWSWLIILGLLTWSLASAYLPGVEPGWTSGQRWAIGFGASLLLFGSVLAHELAHAVVARRRGHPVEHITLHLLGGVSSLGHEPRTARDEFWIAIVGPLTSFALATGFFGVWVLGIALDAGPLATVAGYLTSANLMLGLFNMLPGFPLDGGRVLRSAVWGVKRDMLAATRVAGIAGRVVAGLMVAGGLALALTGGIFNGLWLVMIGWFLWNAAAATYQQQLVETSLGGLDVGALADRDVPRVPPDLSLQDLARDYVLGRNEYAFFVAPTDDAEIMGMVTLGDLRAAPRDLWGSTSVYRAMTPRSSLPVLDAGMGAMDALQVMSRHNLGLLPVVSGRRVIGVLNRAALLRAIQFRGSLPRAA